MKQKLWLIVASLFWKVITFWKKVLLYKIENLTTKELKILAKARMVDGYQNMSRHLKTLKYIPCFWRNTFKIESIKCKANFKLSLVKMLMNIDFLVFTCVWLWRYISMVWQTKVWASNYRMSYQRGSIEKVFLKFSQNSQGNPCARLIQQILEVKKCFSINFRTFF